VNEIAPFHAADKDALAAHPSTSPPPRNIHLLVRIAAAIANPLDIVDDHFSSLDPFSAADLKAIAANPYFKTPINHALIQALSFDTLPLTAECFTRMWLLPQSRLALHLATSDLNVLQIAARFCAAAILHRRVIGLVLKADRARVRAAFGEDAFQVAVQEAPLLHANLAELNNDINTAGIFDPAKQLDVQLIRAGLQGLACFVEAREPALIRLFVSRFPPEMELENRHQTINKLNDAHCDQLAKLLRRRVDSWRDISE